MALNMIRRFGLMALVGALLVGCAPKEKPPPPTIAQLTIVAAADANPNPGGRASPAVVFIFGMKPGAGFDSASYDQLSGDLGKLAESMKQIGRIVVVPGKTTKKIFELEKDVSDIGIAVGYRQIGSAQWRAKAPVKANKVTLIDVNVGKNVVTVKAK